MVLLGKIILLVFFAEVYGQISRNRRGKLPLKWRRRLLEKPIKQTQICYDIVGCFNLPHKLTPLKKAPESPTTINTKFYLFTRHTKFSNPEVLYYEDYGSSVNASRINFNGPTKVIIHGFMGSWTDDDPLNTARMYLQICNCSIILVDWEKGAKGHQYAIAAANTEIVGRQLGILLAHMVNKGLRPHYLHLIGFSLGAHVAGCASEFLKDRGHLLGRITGLDAASPLFRHNQLREKSKKLDKDDAIFVDAIHTDSSPFFTDGFGLLEPIGHVDFFPNGGFEQPGCIDRKASVVMSHLDKSISKETACSHLRSWKLFLESLRIKLEKKPKCEFLAFKCKNGLESFQRGLCFPVMHGGVKSLLNSSYRTDLGKMGEEAVGDGIMYLMTKSRYPFCGMQMQVHISVLSETAEGAIHFKMQQGNIIANAKLKCSNLSDAFGLSATDYNGFNNAQNIAGNIVFKAEDNKESNSNDLKKIVVGSIKLNDMNGQSWSSRSNRTLLKHEKAENILLYPENR